MPRAVEVESRSNGVNSKLQKRRNHVDELNEACNEGHISQSGDLTLINPLLDPCHASTPTHNTSQHPQQGARL